jgi:hypothetical protein
MRTSHAQVMQCTDENSSLSLIERAYAQPRCTTLPVHYRCPTSHGTHSLPSRLGSQRRPHMRENVKQIGIA